MTHDRTRRLAAVWFADIVGYTELSARDEDRALEILDEFKRLASNNVEEHDGRVVQFLGDGVLAVFESTDGGLRAALALHEAFEHVQAGHAHIARLRIGLHVGEVVTGDDGDILGDGVNLASRLQSEAEPGQVVLSGAAHGMLKQRTGFDFQLIGTRILKGVPEPVEVYAIGVSSGDATRAARSAPAAALPQGVRPVLLGAVVLLIAVGGWGLWTGATADDPDGQDAGAAAALTLDPARIAVLYFDDHSEGQNLGHMADGLTEGLIHALAQVEGLEVLSRNGVKSFRGSAADHPEIARRLMAGSFVEGSVIQSGDRIRVTAQLIDVASGAHWASMILDRPLGELFALQDELTDEISRTLRERLGIEIAAIQERSRASSVDAWVQYRRAVDLREQSALLWENDREAADRTLAQVDSLLMDTERDDPGWADPALLRGWVAADQAVRTGDLPGRSDPRLLEDGIGHAERALRIEPDYPEALELRGILRALLAEEVADRPAAADSLTRLAEADLRRAVSEDPGLARSWWRLSEILRVSTRFGEAKLAAERALDADAFLEQAPLIINQLFLTSFELAEASDTDRWCREGRRRFPEDGNFVLCALLILVSFDEVDPDVSRAWALVDSMESVTLEQDWETFQAYTRMQVAKVLARAGLPDSARAVMRTARGGDEIQSWLAYDEAHAHLLLGDPAAAIRLLEAYLADSPELRSYLPADWWFADLADDPAFRALTNPPDGGP